MKKFFIAFLMISGILFYGCAKKEKPIIKEAEKMPEAGVDQKVLSFNLAGYAEDGKKKWEVLGESANVIADIVNMDNIVAKAYGADTSMTLTAKKGEYDKLNNKVKLWDNVVATTNDGAKLNTDQLIWDSKGGKVSTDSFVKVEKDNMSSEGKGASLDPKFKQIEFKDEVIVKQGATTVTCDGPLEVDYEKNIAIFNNNVKVTDERGEIKANKMEVIFDKASKKLVKVIAEGNVNIVRGENSTFSEKAIYTFDDGKAVLTGSPKIVIFPEKGTDLNALTGN